MFSLILTQTLTHAFRKGGGAFGACAFYIIVVTLFTFALGPEGMRAHAGAVMGVAMLLANVTALPLIFERDHEDGTLEQFLLQPAALELLALAKILGHWLAIAGPILAVSPLVAVLADIPTMQTMHILCMLLLASPTLTAIAAVAAALTLDARRGGLLQALILLPLTVPVLIFAVSAGEGAPLLLGAMLSASLPLSCMACAALIRMSEE